MLPRDQLSLAQVARLAATAPVYPVGDLRQQAFQRALAGQLGRTLQADVLARLDDGSFVVKVADQAARIPLPPATQVGARVPLTLVALQPRPTFQVGAGGDAPVFAEAGLPPAPGAAVDAAPLAYVEGRAAAALSRNAALLAAARGMSALPFGGVGDSGFGRIHGEDGLREFTRAQAVTKQRFATPMPVMSFSRSARAMRALVGLARARHG